MDIALVAAIVAVMATLIWFGRDRIRGRRKPLPLRVGKPMPEFSARTEDGAPVTPATLRGSAVVFLFVRGSWCPFCSRQVKSLTRYYRAITDAGARLVLVTSRPLDTTRRVAELFGVDFEFWLDDDLQAARQLGLLYEDGVARAHRESFGTDTTWPATVIVDADGVIQFSELSRFVVDRPNPQKLLTQIQRLR